MDGLVLYTISINILVFDSMILAFKQRTWCLLLNNNKLNYKHDQIYRINIVCKYMWKVTRTFAASLIFHFKYRPSLKTMQFMSLEQTKEYFLFLTLGHSI